MKKVLKIVAWGLGIVAALVVLGLGYLYLGYPDVGPVRDLSVASTPERIARGSYLANHVSVCIDCHSTRDWSHFAGPIVPGTEGKGGERFDETLGFPGMIYAHNITPAGLGSQSDGVLYRAITTGVDKDGKAMFPIMPYTRFNTMSEEDILSIIAYVRTLKPIENTPPQTVLNAPMNLIVRTIPLKRTPQPEPDTSNAYAYGKYLVNAASCAECHTQQVKGKPLPGMDFAGGFRFPFPNGAVARSANITPDEETGIGAWSETDFVNRFKFYDNAEARTLKPEAVGYNSVMPWTMYAGMTERDLTAIYKYLRTVTPVKNKVEKYTEAAK
ncbi:MAG: c-type cytochrome [Ignavibacteriales bacterium]|nr:c-type cytochrome [Ignavibacteriales bacterium]